MSTDVNLEPVLRFLDGLRQNNNKAWFEVHRPDYQAARVAFEGFVNVLIDELRESDQLQGLVAKDCIPRIYRDIRFSKDKSPYKTNLAALIGPGGWKGLPFGSYVSIEPHGCSLVAGGLYDPSTEQLNLFRQTIDRDAAGFKRVTQTRDFIETFGEVGGERLKTAPKGYDPSHPEIRLLQLKQVTALRHFTDQEVLAAGFPERVLHACRVMKPFLEILQGTLK